MTIELIVAVLVSFPLSVVGFGVTMTSLQKRWEKEDALADGAWKVFADRKSWILTHERYLDDRLVEREAAGQSSGLPVFFETKTGLSGDKRQTRGCVDLRRHAMPRVAVHLRDYGPLVVPGLRPVKTGDLLFDRNFVVFAEDPQQACAFLGVEARAAYMEILRLSKPYLPLAGATPDHLPSGEIPPGPSFRNGQVWWVVPGRIYDADLLEKCCDAMCEVAVALREAPLVPDPEALFSLSVRGRQGSQSLLWSSSMR